MSQSAAASLAPLPFEFVYEDDVPSDDHWHLIERALLIGQIRHVLAERGRSDYFTSGNIFVYYSFEQAEDVVKGRPYLQGPDFFYVGGVDRRRERHAWVAWEEEGRLPDLIVEMLTPKTAQLDRTTKKELYARTFRTPEYYLYDFETTDLEGFLLEGDGYVPMVPNAEGRLWSRQLGLELGRWHGLKDQVETTWLRFYYPDGSLVPTPEEAARQRAEAARQRADAAEARAEAARQRAEAALADLERVRARLGDL